MAEQLHDSSLFRTWVVCEPSPLDRPTPQRRRWLPAVRRFAPQQMPESLMPLVLPAEPATATAILAEQESAVIVWSVRRDSLLATCDLLVETALAAPSVLQLVANEGLTSGQQLTLSEFPCAAIVRNPEDLPRLTPMIQGYFARSLELLN